MEAACSESAVHHRGRDTQGDRKVWGRRRCEEGEVAVNSERFAEPIRDSAAEAEMGASWGRWRRFGRWWWCGTLTVMFADTRAFVISGDIEDNCDAKKLPSTRAVVAEVGPIWCRISSPFFQ